MTIEVGMRESEIHVDYDGLLVLTSKASGWKKKLVLVSFRALVLHAKNYPPTAGHPGERRMHNTWQYKFFWSDIANDLYLMLNFCATCGRDCKSPNRKRHLQLRAKSGSPYFLAIDILGSLPQTRNGNTFVNVIFLPLLESHARSSHVIGHGYAFNNFVSWWLEWSNRISNFLQNKKGSLFMRLFLEMLRKFLGVKHMTTTSNHPCTSKKVEWYIETNFGRSRN